MNFVKTKTLEQQKKVAILTLWAVGGGIGLLFIFYLINLNLSDKNKYNEMGSYKLRNLSDAFVFVNIDNKHLLTKFISFEYEDEVEEVTIAKAKQKPPTEPTQVETITRIVTPPPVPIAKPAVKAPPKKPVEDDGGFSIKPVPKK